MLLVKLESVEPISDLVTLFVHVENSGQRATTAFSFRGHPLAIPPTQTLALVLDAARRGAVRVHVEALDEQSAVVVDGEACGEVVPGERRELTVRLDEFACGDKPDLGAAPPRD